jgi:hypothetical protein
MDTMLTNDRELSLLVAMETALVDERYDVRPCVLGYGGLVVSGFFAGVLWLDVMPAWQSG